MLLNQKEIETKYPELSSPTTRKKRPFKLNSECSNYMFPNDILESRKNDQICIFALLGTILTIILLCINYDTYYHIYINEYECFILKIMISVTTGITIMLQCHYYHILSRKENWKWSFPSLWSSFFDTNLVIKAAVEIFVVLIHPFPGLPIEYDDEIGLLMLCRMFLFLRFIKYHSYLFMLRNKILDDIPYLKRKKPIYGWNLVARMFFNTHPIITVVAVYGFIMLSGGFCIMMAERKVNEPLTSFGNAVYFTIISCASIGYGDISPNTVLGKIIVSIFALIGIITLSFLVSVSDRALSLRNVELYSIQYVDFLLLKTKKGNVSAVYLQSFWRLRRLMKKNNKKWPYNPEEAASLNIFQQRTVALLIGKIKVASRSMHRYRIRELAMTAFTQESEETKNDDNEIVDNDDEDVDEEKALKDEMKKTKDALMANFAINKMKKVLKVK